MPHRSKESTISSSDEATVAVASNVIRASAPVTSLRPSAPATARGRARIRSDEDTTVIEARAPWTPAADELWAWAEAANLRIAKRRKRVIIGVVALVVAGVATIFAATAAIVPVISPAAVTTNTHVPVAVSGPTIPVPVRSGPRSDTVSPSIPAGLRVSGRSDSAVTITWADAVDDLGIAGYKVSRNGVLAGTALAPVFADSGLEASTAYQYTVAAFDAAGNVSADSAPVSAVTLQIPDVSPPTIPSNLHSNGQSLTSIVLAWSRSRDNVGVAGYEVYRNGVLVADVGDPGYTDSGLTPATTYSYRVRAFDASNNASGDSLAITVATAAVPDTTAPTVPGGLGAIGVSTSVIEVTWAAATDNVGVTGYQVYRDGVFAANVASTAFTDLGLPPSASRSYQVRAVDAAGNQSALSSPASGSTLDPAPDPTPTPSPSPTPDPPSPSPSPDPDPEIMSVTFDKVIVDCVVNLELTVVASAPMSADVTYAVSGLSGGSEHLTFDTGNLSWTKTFVADGTVDGIGTASAGGKDGLTGWSACTPP